MDRETAAIISNARAMSQWAAGAVVEVDALLATTQVRPLSADEQSRGLHVLRGMLVKMTQQETLLEWAIEVRRAPWWRRWWMRLRGRAATS